MTWKLFVERTFHGSESSMESSWTFRSPGANVPRNESSTGAKVLSMVFSLQGTKVQRNEKASYPQVKGRQRSRNFGRDRLSVGELGAKKCPGHVFFCRQYQTIFRQLRNGWFSPNLATTRESWVKRRIQTKIYEKFPFRGHPEYLPYHYNCKVSAS